MAGTRRSQVALSLGTLAIGAGAAAVTAQLPAEGGYAGVGPNFIPAVVSAGLLALGLWLLADALRGGWKGLPAASDAGDAGAEHAFHGDAFAWVSGGLFLHMLLIGSAGFVIAGATLFACVARGFGSARPLRDAALGLLLALAVYLFFTALLNVSLPAGVLAPLLGTAGI
ncbi:MAG: tripartite tricarboxylate transporter TctB family protein [Betaproteobacteria bacterium]|nr:tripartite tricarboxylate transporter TctB family protein [Betaproteobacteria bacterium]